MLTAHVEATAAPTSSPLERQQRAQRRDRLGASRGPSRRLALALAWPVIGAWLAVCDALFAKLARAQRAAGRARRPFGL